MDDASQVEQLLSLARTAGELRTALNYAATDLSAAASRYQPDSREGMHAIEQAYARVTRSLELLRGFHDPDRR